jgi:O-antigen ligase
MDEKAPLIRPKEGIAFITLVGLLFSTTNLVPVSAVPSALFLLLTPLLPFTQGAWPPVTRWALAYYLISIVSTLMYWPASFLEYDFYRYDGNFILSFAPLLAIPLVHFRTDVDRWLLAFLIAVTAINVLAEIAIFAMGLRAPLGLFTAANAFGGFLMFSNAVAYVWWRKSRKMIPLFLFALNLLLLFITYSRGSELGLILGIMSVWLVKHDKGWVVALILVSLVLTEASILYFTYPIFLRTRNVFDLIYSSGADTKEANILLRAFEDWPRGLYLFFHSPIFGGGFGSVNDFPFRFHHEIAFFQFNDAVTHRFNSMHAHNTYIHILGEQGLFGFGVFMGLWRSVYRFIRDTPGSSFARDVLHVSFWTLTYASFTEHRIPTPSNAFPFMLSLLLFSASSLGAEIRSTRVPSLGALNEKGA